MKNSLALNLIADVMGWDDVKTTQEYDWLRLMAAVKYDGYADFAAGAGFIEALVDWLRQFQAGDRETAYRFVKKRLVFISTAEMQRVIEAFIPETVTPYLRKAVAEEHKIAPFEVWSDPVYSEAFYTRFRRCLFVGLSDGSRIDILRRSHSGLLSQEQVVPMMNVDLDKWESLGEDLCEELGKGAKFDDVYLIDDFTASGTTFIRIKDGKPKGKLPKFEKIVTDAREALGEKFPIADGYRLHIHHHVSTRQARSALIDRVKSVVPMLSSTSFDVDVVITEGLLLPNGLPLGVLDNNQSPGGSVELEAVGLQATSDADREIIDLCEVYYDRGLFKKLEKHCREAGLVTMCYGYGSCALPLVLEHNTPNNAVPLLWSELGDQAAPRTRALFRRRDRHG
ncbi:MAG: hypothetical protein WBC93_19685 [Sulfitobacter sp.]